MGLFDIFKKKDKEFDGMLYIPYIMNNETGKIDKRVGPALTKDEADRWLKKYYSKELSKGDAVSKPLFTIKRSI